MVDFGLAKPFIDADTGRHIPYSENRSICGTLRYISLNVHKVGIYPGALYPFNSGLTLSFCHLQQKFIYSSLLKGKEQSRRDDLLALGYMFYHFLLDGQLPWAGIKDGERRKRYQKVFIIKDKADLTMIGPGHPREFDLYMR